MALNLTVNGKPFNAPDKCYINDLIDILGYKNIAIEVNEVIIAKSKYNSFALNNTDKIEIIHAVAGG